MTETNLPNCAICSLPVASRACYAESGKGPDNCPTHLLTELTEETRQEYADPGIREFARLASIQEAECYLNRDKQPYLL